MNYRPVRPDPPVTRTDGSGISWVQHERSIRFDVGNDFPFLVWSARETQQLYSGWMGGYWQAYDRNRGLRGGGKDSLYLFMGAFFLLALGIQYFSGQGDLIASALVYAAVFAGIWVCIWFPEQWPRWDRSILTITAGGRFRLAKRFNGGRLRTVVQGSVAKLASPEIIDYSTEVGREHGEKRRTVVRLHYDGKDYDLAAGLPPKSAEWLAETVEGALDHVASLPKEPPI